MYLYILITIGIFYLYKNYIQIITFVLYYLSKIQILYKKFISKKKSNNHIISNNNLTYFYGHKINSISLNLNNSLKIEYYYINKKFTIIIRSIQEYFNFIQFLKTNQKLKKSKILSIVDSNDKNIINIIKQYEGPNKDFYSSIGLYITPYDLYNKDYYIEIINNFGDKFTFNSHDKIVL